MTYDQQIEIEDYLQECGVFVNGITGKPAHSDSYMTVVNFDALKEAMAGHDYNWPAFRERICRGLNTQPAMAVACSQMKEHQ